MKLVPVHQLAQEYKTDARNIINWAKSGKITASRIGTVWMIDEPSLKRYLSYHTKKANQKKYLEEELQEKQEEINEMIAKFDDFLFSMRSLNNITPLFRIIIHEMSLLLPEERMQEAFVTISTGGSIYEAATKYGVSYDRMCTLYRKFQRMIIQKMGFIKSYRERLAELEYKVRELTLLNENKRAEIIRLSHREISDDRLQELYDKNGSIPQSVLDMLCMSLEKDVQIETRAVNALKNIDVETVEQLYRYVSTYGFNRLLELNGFGSTSLRRLKYALRKKGLLDHKDESPLFDYFR